MRSTGTRAALAASVLVPLGLAAVLARMAIVVSTAALIPATHANTTLAGTTDCSTPLQMPLHFVATAPAPGSLLEDPLLSDDIVVCRDHWTRHTTIVNEGGAAWSLVSASDLPFRIPPPEWGAAGEASAADTDRAFLAAVFRQMSAPATPPAPFIGPGETIEISDAHLIGIRVVLVPDHDLSARALAYERIVARVEERTDMSLRRIAALNPALLTAVRTCTEATEAAITGFQAPAFDPRLPELALCRDAWWDAEHATSAVAVPKARAVLRTIGDARRIGAIAASRARTWAASAVEIETCFLPMVRCRPHAVVTRDVFPSPTP